MKGRIKYQFSETTWQYKPPGGWYFVSLPIKLSKEIRQSLGKEEEGWGRLKVVAIVGSTEWSTAIWFDTKLNTYLLPLKSEIRKKERIEVGEKINVVLSI